MNWKGANWHFRSQQNLDAFRTQPERFAPQYGGYCAYAVADGKLVGIDPQVFTLADGKLYLNYAPNIKKKWLADRDNYIRKADARWPELVD